MAATVSFRLNRPREKDGSLKTKPVSILICYYRSGLTVERASGHRVVPSLFTGSRVDKSVPRSSKINKDLSDKENQLLNLPFEKLTRKEEEQKAISIIKGIVEDQTEQTTIEKKTLVVSIVQQFIAQYEREKEAGTVKRYRGLLKKLLAFNPNLTLEDLDLNFYDEFKAFLYNQPNPVYTGFDLRYDRDNSVYLLVASDSPACTIGLFDDVVFKYFVNLKTVCLWAEKRGHEVNQSYISWEIIKREYPPISLTEEELIRIESLNLKGHLDIARDYLVLECRTGQRISDLKKIKPENIKGNIWTLTQKKGNRIKAKHINFPLVGFSSSALLILEKYNYELPKLSEQKLNEHIKSVSRLAGITTDTFIERWAGSKKVRITGLKYEFISTHTGKKTFITVLASKGIPIKVLSDLTGTSIKTIERHYLGTTNVEITSSWLEKADPNSKSIMKITA
jgi:site-specific recombinase XerD